MGPCRAAELMVVKSCSLSASANLKIRFAFRYEFGTADASTMYFPAGPNSYWEYT